MVETTHIYLQANLAIKEQHYRELPPGRFGSRPDTDRPIPSLPSWMGCSYVKMNT